jgi:hypothetical protein
MLQDFLVLLLVLPSLFLVCLFLTAVIVFFTGPPDD